MDPNLTKPPQGSESPQDPSPTSQNPNLGNIPDTSNLPWTTNPAATIPVAHNPPAPPSPVPQSPTFASSFPQTGQQNIPQPAINTDPAQVQPSTSWTTPVAMPEAKVATPPEPPPPALDMPVDPQFPQDSHKGKFPIMLVTGVVLVIITGFSGSYLYFRTQGSAKDNKVMTPKITPPAKETTPVPNDAEKESNPFDDQTYENPFSNESSYINPFGEDEQDIGTENYQNPFETETQ